MIPRAVVKEVVKYSSRSLIYRTFTISRCIRNGGQSDTGDEASSIPWYLRTENRSQAENIVELKTYDFPADLPSRVQEILKLLEVKYGLTDFKVFDLSLLPVDHPKSVENQSSERYVIIASGKSEKHIYKASYDLKQHIKNEYGYQSQIEGMVSNSISPTMRRRLAKRARQGPPATHKTYGIEPNTWVRCEIGVDGAVVHILSPERRKELQLEQLYQEKQDQDDVQEQDVTGGARIAADTTLDKESIFYGLRRGFHTSTQKCKCSNASVDAAQHMDMDTDMDLVYNQLLGEENTVNLKGYKEKFDSLFEASPVQLSSIDKRFQFYRALHLVDPSVASLDLVERILLEKYASFELVSQQIDWNLEIVNDTIKYMELLVDTPTIGISSAEKLDKLSRFISKTATFLTDEIHFFAVERFQVLLWALTCEQNTFINASKINSIIELGGENLETTKKTAIISQNEQGTRDVREMFRRINYGKRGAIPLWLREQMLFTYANTRHWKYFWREWTGLRLSISIPSEFLHYFVRVIILLSIINDKIVLRDFFGKFWNNANGVSIIGEFEKNNKLFNSENEKLAFKKALLLIYKNHCNSFWIQDAYEFANRL
ncbi:ATP25 [Candida oxycetoniae]|uniref:ATPase synthesis protein 25 n=1 Tax=Candida oxycetoniae TaxID=497107 RepID=A0AAI9SWF6_9ASCO|nr:ATP25 [Candida oxycetoniae]KAI3403795.2 ATP25 [Candida oxycetoniae]